MRFVKLTNHFVKEARVLIVFICLVIEPFKSFMSYSSKKVVLIECKPVRTLFNRLWVENILIIFLILIRIWKKTAGRWWIFLNQPLIKIFLKILTVSCVFIFRYSYWCPGKKTGWKFLIKCFLNKLEVHKSNFYFI